MVDRTDDSSALPATAILYQLYGKAATDGGEWEPRIKGTVPGENKKNWIFFFSFCIVNELRDKGIRKINICEDNPKADEDDGQCWNF